MSFLQLLSLLGVGILFWYWLDSMRIKEQAHRICKRVCDEAGVHFLDDTVVLKKIRLRRDQEGYMRLLREYQYEFTSDGSRRYTGMITMRGRSLVDSYMEPFRITSSPD